MNVQAFIFKSLFICSFGGGGGGGSSQEVEIPKPAPIPAPVSYRTEDTREEVKSGSNRKALGSALLQRRTATPSGGGFGGQKQTLG